MTATASTKRLATSALLIAASVLGSYISIGPMSITLDSAGGFLAAMVLGPGAGALVAAVGHMAAATLKAFPLTPLFHLAVTFTMAGVGALGGLTARRFGRWAAALVIVLANGVAAPAVLAFLPNPMGSGLFAALVLPLTLGAALNACIAALVAGRLKRAAR